MKVCRLLTEYAGRYETADFLQGDPSWFMQQVQGKRNQETMAFIASCLSYGSRQVFLPRIQYILDCTEGEPYSWISMGRYRHDIPDDNQCFYRLYTNSMMRSLFRALQHMYQDHGDMESYIRSYAGIDKPTQMTDAITAIEAICTYFLKQGVTGIVPKDTRSCCKRVCMFLRWMVRTGSPVDLGLWAELIDRRTLIMPLDTHVIHQSLQLGLITSKSATMAAAQKLTDRLRQIFPDDPLKADFALFGYGVSQ
ncbi:MAG: TIGR02757 family protein [Prevotella sp.]|nr:TIGR02757 family protein [Prevotella sp.]